MRPLGRSGARQRAHQLALQAGDLVAGQRQGRLDRGQDDQRRRHGDDHRDPQSALVFQAGELREHRGAAQRLQQHHADRYFQHDDRHRGQPIERHAHHAVGIAHQLGHRPLEQRQVQPGGDADRRHQDQGEDEARAGRIAPLGLLGRKVGL